MRSFIATVPGFGPGVVVAVLLGAAIGGVIGRWLGVRRSVGAAVVIAFGIVLSATLTPLRGVLEQGVSSTGGCDFSRLGLVPLRELLSVDDSSLNVLLFIPLGATIGFVPRSRAKWALTVLAIALPFLIEFGQLSMRALARECQSADIFDNLTGLVIGLVLGALGGRIVDR